MFRLARMTSFGLDLACGLLPRVFAGWDRGKAARKRRPHWVRLELEPLEERALLSASIFGSVWNDLIGNGLRQAGDPGVAGVTLFLDQNGNHTLDSSVTTVTAPSTAISPAPGQLGGLGLFASTLQAANLPSKLVDLAVNMDLTNNSPDPITVAVVSPVGLTVPNLPSLFNIQPGEHFTGTFDGNSTNAFLPSQAVQTSATTGTFRPQVYFTDPQAHIYDGDPNGTWGLVFFASPSDIGMVSLASWSLSFTTSELTTQTSANGSYSFTDLQPGTYHVMMALHPGDVATSAAGGAQDVTLSANQTAAGVDFGIKPAPAPPPGPAPTDSPVNAGAGVQNSPSIAVDPHDPSHLVVAYMDYSLLSTGYAGIGVGVSKDGGKTWSNSSIPLPADYAAGAADPKAHFDGQGHVYVSFMAATFKGAKPNETDPSSTQRSRGFASNDGIFVARGDVQADGSVRWSNPVAVAAHLYTGAAAPFDVMPDSAVDGSGNVYVTWARFYPAGQFPGSDPNINNSDVMIAVSADGGQTWTTRLQTQGGLQVSAIRDPQFDSIDTGSSGRGKLAFPHVSIGPAGDVYVATFSGGNFAVFHSSDGGASFVVPDYNNNLDTPFFQQIGAAVPFATLGVDNFRTIPARDIVADPSHPGRVYVAEALGVLSPPVTGTTPVDYGDIIFARSDDYGLTWQHLFTVGPDAPYLDALAASQRDNTLPVLNDDNGGRFIGFDQQTQNEVVSGQAMPAMSVDAQGNLTVIWYDSRRDPAGNTGNPGSLLDVFGTVSTDGGLTFKPNFRITDAATPFDPNAGAFNNANGKLDFFLGDAIGVAAANGTAYAVWTDTRNGNQQIFFSNYSLSPAPAPPAGDRFSPNSTMQTATQLGQVTAQQVYPRLGLVAGSSDEWFSVQAGATGSLVLSVTDASPGGSLTLGLRDASGNSLAGGVVTNVLDATGAVVGQQLVFPSVSGQTYLVDVHGDSSSGISYTLVAAALTADFGTQVQAAKNDSVASGALNLYRLAVGVQGTLQVTITGGNDVQGNLNFTILGADGQRVLASDAAAGVSAGQTDSLTIPVTQGQAVFLQVSGAALTSASGSFTLQLTNLDQLEVPGAATAFFPTTGDPTSIAVADLTGSKRADIVVTNTNASDTLGVLGGNGDGTFQAERQFDVGPGQAGTFTAGNRQISVVDVNGDGILDAIVPNFRAGTISVLLGNGDGTFQPQRIFNALPSPDSLVTGVFTGDGHTDAVVLQNFAQGQGSASFAFLKGRGDGTFSAPTIVHTVFTNATSMVAGDFNGDGKTDVIVFSFNDSRGQLFLGNGDGTFKDAGTFTLPEATFDAKAVDLNGDGKLDLITTSTNSGKVYVMLGNGDGTFQPPQAYLALAPSGGGNISVKGLTVVNFDGHQDIVVTAAALSGGESAQVILLPGLVDSGGNFAGFGAPQELATVSVAGKIVAGDFNGDGAMDLAVADKGGVTVIYGKPLTLAPNAVLNLGSVAHLKTLPRSIVAGHEDAVYTYTVPTEAAPGSGAEVVDFSADFQDVGGADLQLVVSDASRVLGFGTRFRIEAPQGDRLTVHVIGLPGLAGGTPGFGAYSLDINVLPQVVSVQAESPLPGGPATSLVLTLQGDRLDPATAENPASYRVTWFGPDGKQGTADDQVIPVAAIGAGQPVIYNPGANVDVASGLTYPTAVRQTITLLFAAPLPAGSYEVRLASDIQAAPLSVGEVASLPGDATFAGHPLVSARDGIIENGSSLDIANLVGSSGTPNPDLIGSGTPFLTQMASDLNALLDAQLKQHGDDPAITARLNEEILARFAAALGTGPTGLSVAVAWLDPVSLDLQAPQGGQRAAYSLESSKASNSLTRTYVEVGGNVEVMVMVGVSGTFKLDVGDVPQTARGGGVVFDSTGSQLLSFTSDLRSGTTEFLVKVTEAATDFAGAVTPPSNALSQTAAALLVATLLVEVPAVGQESLAVNTSTAAVLGASASVAGTQASAPAVNVVDEATPDNNPADKKDDEKKDKNADDKKDNKPADKKDDKQEKKMGEEQDKKVDAKQNDKQEKNVEENENGDQGNQSVARRRPEMDQCGDRNAVDRALLMWTGADAAVAQTLGNEAHLLPDPGSSPAEADAYWMALLLVVGAGPSWWRDSSELQSKSRCKPRLPVLS